MHVELCRCQCTWKYLLKVDSVSAAVSLVPVLVFKANYQWSDNLTLAAHGCCPPVIRKCWDKEIDFVTSNEVYCWITYLYLTQSTTSTFTYMMGQWWCLCCCCCFLTPTFLGTCWRPLLCCNFLTSNITFLYKKVGYPIKHEREIAEEGFSILLVLLLGIKESF